MDYISTIDEPTGSGNRYLSDKIMRLVCDWLTIVTLHGRWHCEAVKWSRDTYGSVGIAALYFALASRTLKKFSDSWREYLANLWFDIFCLWASYVRTVKLRGLL